jgi:hypothetical protein
MVHKKLYYRSTIMDKPKIWIEINWAKHTFNSDISATQGAPDKCICLLGRNVVLILFVMLLIIVASAESCLIY